MPPAIVKSLLQFENFREIGSNLKKRVMNDIFINEVAIEHLLVAIDSCLQLSSLLVVGTGYS